MRIQVSSSITFAYKYIFFPLWATLALSVTCVACFQTRELSASIIFLGLVLLMILFGWLMIRKIRQVYYDEERVYLTDINFERTIDLREIKSINEGSILSFDPWFEIELHPVNGKAEKFDFMPGIEEHISYSLFGRLSKKLIGFKQTIYRSKTKPRQGMERHV